MTKEDILKWVEELQERRDNIDNEIFFCTLPIDHHRINFSESMGKAVEYLLSVYSELVLNEIQRRKEVNHVSK